MKIIFEGRVCQIKENQRGGLGCGVIFFTITGGPYLLISYREMKKNLPRKFPNAAGLCGVSQSGVGASVL